VPDPLALSIVCHDDRVLRVAFSFVAGRFRQTVQLHSSSGELLESWEDDTVSSDEDWPASPPIQQLSLESINNRPTLLGVGQAGKSHWSISVEAIERAAAETDAAIRFDLACRTQATPDWLGSTYLKTSNQGDDRTALKLEADASIPGQTIEGLKIICPTESIGPPSSSRASSKKTFRWCYLICPK
jgi:hypothetical protein